MIEVLTLASDPIKCSGMDSPTLFRFLNETEILVDASTPAIETPQSVTSVPNLAVPPVPPQPSPQPSPIKAASPHSARKQSSPLQPPEDAEQGGKSKRSCESAELAKDPVRPVKRPRSNPEGAGTTSQRKSTRNKASSTAIDGGKAEKGTKSKKK
ncbi:hypothetical protein B0H14DRAFT_2626348 [Mycena olivaceomarginata]|nr:hypothetical protein B0H14DRAFT_2626348 [Mycena olivaceomarginata]